MANLTGTRVPSMIVPYTDQDTYPTHDSRYGIGGAIEVPTSASLAGLSPSRLRRGMRATAQDTLLEYQFNGSEWMPYNESSINSAFVINYTTLAALYADKALSDLTATKVYTVIGNGVNISVIYDGNDFNADGYFDVYQNGSTGLIDYINAGVVPAGTYRVGGTLYTYDGTTLTYPTKAKPTYGGKFTLQIVGDSIVMTAKTQTIYNSITSWCCAKSKGVLRHVTGALNNGLWFDNVTKFGTAVAGWTTTDIDTIWNARVAALQSNFVVLQIGFNNLNGGQAEPTAELALRVWITTKCAQIQAWGGIPILMTLPPTPPSWSGSPQYTNLHNQWRRENASSLGALLFDYEQLVLDPNNPDGSQVITNTMRSPAADTTFVATLTNFTSVAGNSIVNITVTGGITNPIRPGHVISGAGIPTGAYILSFGTKSSTGTGSNNGTYAVYVPIGSSIAAGTAVAVTALAYDGVHPNDILRRTAGTALYNLLSTYLPAQDLGIRSNLSTNLMNTDPLFQTNTGSVTGLHSGSVLPAQWLQWSATTSLTTSLVAAGDGIGNWIQCSDSAGLSTPGVGPGVAFNKYISGGLTVGDKYRFYLEVGVVSGTNIAAIQVAFELSAGSVDIAQILNAVNPGGNSPIIADPNATNGVFVSEDFVIGASGPVNFYAFIQPYFTTTGASVWEIRRFKIEKVNI